MKIIFLLLGILFFVGLVVGGFQIKLLLKMKKEFDEMSKRNELKRKEHRLKMQEINKDHNEIKQEIDRRMSFYSKEKDRYRKR
ncbi:hypothetical protein JZO80_02885 [Vagococcus fluvialis]|uniref:hypothetical protein n=1 Tax=Vagococcus fluvialis TaxID=2738 RepID=UPI000A340463|nr:hypothetical protein [Vagococcus fluvialis]MBO0419094.1 hypothetical protein [Vagococcus fluvialis]OTP29519.1 hypothetical protein A5798_002687 [Enterococcus sp. 6C8_DIV0013]